MIPIVFGMFGTVSKKKKKKKKTGGIGNQRKNLDHANNSKVGDRS